MIPPAVNLLQFSLPFGIDVGGVLAAIDWRLAMIPLISGIIGYVTNWVGIKMLFCPLFTTLGRFGGPLSLASAATLLRGELRGALPERMADLLRQIDEHVVDGTIYVLVRLDAGDCTAVELLDGPDERETDLVLRGPNGTWGEIIDGDQDVFSAVEQGDLTIDGDPERLLRYASTMGLLGEAAASVKTTRLF